MNRFFIVLSFLIVAFGQPAWVRGFGVLAAAFGFALFWRSMLVLPRPKDRFLLSFIWFACIQGIQLSWMATTDYMGPLILVVYLFLIVGMGLQFGVLSLFFSGPLDLRRCLAIAGCWTIFEWVRLFFLCGFTWNQVGFTLSDSPHSIQFAAVWGIFGLSFWVILANLAALRALLEGSARRIAIWAAVAFFPYAFGLVHQAWIESRITPSSHLNIALIQTGLLPEQKEFLLDCPEHYIEPQLQWERILSLLDEAKELDLIVLPESALPLGAHRKAYDLASVQKYFPREHLPPLQHPYAVFSRGKWKVNNVFLLQALANRYNAWVIAGLDDKDSKGRYNAAFLFHPENKPYERYEKRVLVPIGEYIPLSQWDFISRFVAEQFCICSSFDPGTEAKVFQAPFPIGLSICLEETFGHLTRELRVKGAELFVNLTNDVWFPRSKLPRQHFDHGRVRAAENGVAILRACNTGITGGIDCFGNPLALLPAAEHEAGALYFTLPIRSYATLYTWWGDKVILGISALSLLSHFLFRKKKLL